MSKHTLRKTFFPFPTLINLVKQPLYRNAYALMFNTIGTAGLGMIYWILAARYYPPEVVGWNAAIISAMIFLSNIAQLNLMSVMIRFIPKAGKATNLLVRNGYLISLIFSAAVGSLVVYFGFRSAFFGINIKPGFRLWFILATMASCIFLLQDSVLNGLQQSVWVPVENISYGVAKVVLLVLLASAMPFYGIFTSWTAPMLFTLLPVNLLIFSRLIPGHIRKTKDQAQPIIRRQIFKYMGANYLGMLFVQAVVRLLPLLVTYRVDPKATAYFYVPWTIVLAVRLISTNMATSLTVEGAKGQSDFAAQGYRFLIHMAKLYLPMVAILVLGAPGLLRLSGERYATEGSMLLRLLALSTLPSVVSNFYISVARVKQQNARIVFLQGTYCFFVLGLSYLLLPIYHLTGVGIAVLISEVLVALIVFPFILRLRAQDERPVEMRISRLREEP